MVCSKVEKDAPHRWISPQGEAPVVPEVLPRKGLEFLEAQAGCGRAQCVLCPRGVFPKQIPQSQQRCSGPTLHLTSMCLAGAKSLLQAQIPHCRRSLWDCSKAQPGNEQTPKPDFFFILILFKGGAATATLPPAKVYFSAGKAGCWKLPGKGLCKPGTTKQADTSNELQ